MTRAKLKALEQLYEERLVLMELAGVPKTRVHAEMVAALKDTHDVEVAPGDGFSSWSVRAVLDSGRHRSALPSLDNPLTTRRH